MIKNSEQYSIQNSDNDYSSKVSRPILINASGPGKSNINSFRLENYEFTPTPIRNDGENV